MLFLLKVVLIAALGYIGGVFLPWWAPAAGAFLVGAVIPTRTVNSFLSGFLGVGLLWLLYALALDLQSDSIISAKVAQLLRLERPAAILLAAAFVGALIGGMGALSGDLFRKTLAGRRSDKYR